MYLNGANYAIYYHFYSRLNNKISSLDKFSNILEHVNRITKYLESWWRLDTVDCRDCFHLSISFDKSILSVSNFKLNFNCPPCCCHPYPCPSVTNQFYQFHNIQLKQIDWELTDTDSAADWLTSFIQRWTLASLILPLFCWECINNKGLVHIWWYPRYSRIH